MQVRFTLFLLKELNNFWFHHRWGKQSPVTSINLAIHNSCNLGGQQSHVSKRRGEILGTCTEKTKGNLSSAILEVQQKLARIHHTPQTLILFAWKLELKREGRCQGAEHTKWPHLLTRAAGKWKAPPLASICTLQAHQEQYLSCLARTWRNAIQNVYASSSATIKPTKANELPVRRKSQRKLQPRQLLQSTHRATAATHTRQPWLNTMILSLDELSDSTVPHSPT